MSEVDHKPTLVPEEKKTNDRRLIISFDGVKREFEIPFSLCGSEKALRHLQRALAAALDGENQFYYGWVAVAELPKPGPANTSPLTWREDGSYYSE